MAAVITFNVALSMGVYEVYIRVMSILSRHVTSPTSSGRLRVMVKITRIFPTYDALLGSSWRDNPRPMLKSTKK